MSFLELGYPLLAALLAASLSGALIWLLRSFLLRYALAQPNARSSHRIPTPQGAGIAVTIATLVAASTCGSLVGLTIPPVILGATLFIALIGFVDDVKSIPVAPRLLLQAVAVGAIVLTVPADLRIVPACPLAIERTLLLFAGLWFVNLVNFMDGLDLMTVAEVVPITGTMILLGWIGAFSEAPMILAAALSGAMLGFAPFNRPIAKIFLGDVGSLPIGLLLAWLLLQLAWHQHVTAALLLALYYLADATITLIRRIANREPFWAAHRTHFYQRATDNGFTVPRVVGEVFAVNVVLAMLAVVSIRASSVFVDMIAALLGAAAVALLLYRFSRKRNAGRSEVGRRKRML